MDVDVDEDDISVSHRMSMSRNYKGKRSESAIIVNFVRRDVKESFYRAHKVLRYHTTTKLGYNISNKIFINESLTESNKALFKECIKAKKDEDYKFIWVSNGIKIFLRKTRIALSYNLSLY
jgi:repressor of nif and glnA expression